MKTMRAWRPVSRAQSFKLLGLRLSLLGWFQLQCDILSLKGLVPFVSRSQVAFPLPRGLVPFGFGLVLRFLLPLPLNLSGINYMYHGFCVSARIIFSCFGQDMAGL